MSSGNRAQAPSPRDHLLEVASELFYREGIHAVGVDRILTEAGVTRATLYRHFAGKGELIVAYLKRESALVRERFATATEHAVSPEHRLELAIEAVADNAAHYHTRGCPSINAAVEFPDPGSPVRVVVDEHRAWFSETMLDCLTAAGREDAEAKGAALVMLRDAVQVGSYLDDPAKARTTFIRNARAIAGLP